MSNNILHVELRDRSVIPAEAEILVTVVPRLVDGGTEVRGRLMGPRCRFATTIEVAYHLRPLLIPTGRPAVTLRVIIPEASSWEPESPHLYHGPIELWQDGVRCDAIQIRHGLRHVSTGPRGLRVNGRLLRLRGRRVSALAEEEALSLREQGYNLLVAPVRESTRSIWEVADRIGFFVVGRLEAHQGGEVIADLMGHPSTLGWLLGAEGVAPSELPPGALLGSELPVPPGHKGIGFVALDQAHLDQRGGRPGLLLDVNAADVTDLLQAEPGILGVVEPV